MAEWRTNLLPAQGYKTYNFDRTHASLKFNVSPHAFENLSQNLYYKLVPSGGGARPCPAFPQIRA